MLSLLVTQESLSNQSLFPEKERPTQSLCRDEVVERANATVCRWIAKFGASYPNEGDTLKGYPNCSLHLLFASKTFLQ